MTHHAISASFLRTTAFVLGINLVSKALGVLREAMTAGAFGAGAATDAFFAAWRLPDVVFNSLLGVLVANTFIPVYYQAQTLGPGQARRFASRAATAVWGACALAGLAYFLFAPAIMTLIAPGLEPAKEALAVKLARVLAPMLLLGGVSGLFRSLLHAHKEFIVPAFLPVALNLCVLAAIWLLAPGLGVEALAWGLLAAGMAQALMLFWAVRTGGFAPFAPGERAAAAERTAETPAREDPAAGEAGTDGRGPVPTARADSPADQAAAGRHAKAPPVQDASLGRMGRLMAPVLATFALGNVVPLVEVHLASGISAGAISHLSYAYRLFTLPEQVFVLALSAVLFPFLARDASLGDARAMAAKLAWGLRLSLYLMLPAGVFLAVFGREFVRLFLGWGAFDEAAVTATGLTLGAYACGLFAVCARNLLVDACFAIQRPGLILKAALVMIPVNIGLDWWLAGVLGTPGLSLGFSLTAVAHCALLLRALDTTLERQDVLAVLAALGRAALGGLAVGAACWLARPWLLSLMPGHGLAWRIGLLALAGLAAAGTYALAQALLRSPEQALLAKALRRGTQP